MRASAVAGLVFVNSQDELLRKLTTKRSMASVPFGARYRLIDFALSNLVNAGVSNVGLITKENYRSLMDHVGSGIYWDLDRKSGGLRFLPPYSTVGNRRYNGYVEALSGAGDFIKRSHADYMVLYDADIVANVDIAAAVKTHITNHADVTIVTHKGRIPSKTRNIMLPKIEDNIVTEISFADGETAEAEYGLGIVIFNCAMLSRLVENAYNAEGMSINRDIIAKNLNTLKVCAFRHEGYAAVMDSERAFFDANMDLLNADVRRDLFNKKRPILTKTRDDMPTRYGLSSVAENCFIADGCVIDGTVKNSILFRGVKVEKGAVIENSILMQGTSVHKGAQLNYVISDKNATVGADMILKGTAEKSFMIKKNQTL